MCDMQHGCIVMYHGLAPSRSASSVLAWHDTMMMTEKDALCR